MDFSKYITSISADGTTESIASATISLSIPKHASDVFSFDGNYILQPNLEVVILMRGYFPMKNFGGQGQDLDERQGFNADDVPMYPYYQVFRGVVTNVSHDFSGGFYTASLQCSNLLHFWQNLKLSVNGSVFGKRPAGSLVEPSLIGHKFTGANPYSIIYTLVKVGFGAAYGVDFTISQGTNIKALDDDERSSLYAHAAQWWEKRWTEHSGNLRMYGINGTIYNALQQAYLGAWYDTRSGERSFSATAKQIYAVATHEKDFDPQRSAQALKRARELAYDPISTSSAIYDTSGGAGTKFATEDVLRMQAFVLDIGKMGSVNMFETEYMSKLEIVEAVKTLTGYEFFQDVDGDLVFKPPMYNMDTRDDPVYRIQDRDLISISESEGEPEATMVKGTGSQFANVTGVGLDGWLGVGGVYIDYRLVAKYGYREETFESAYLSGRQAVFVSAMNRLDLANVGMKSATITIPMRPELRPGYPVYVEHLDCFYYVKSFSHSFSYGGQATTSINAVAKRAKFLPPMQASGSNGKLPSVSDVRLDAPDEYPSQPLYAYPRYMGGDSADPTADPPRVIGFPNVVLALDPDKVNLDTVDLSQGVITAEGYVQIALSSGFLERGPEDQPDTFILRSSNTSGELIPLTQIQREWEDASEALAAGSQEPDLNTALGKILQAIAQQRGGVDTPDVKNLVNFLSLQTSLKGSFSPGTSIAGKYRYFSCSHPDPKHQAPGNLLVDQEQGSVSTSEPGSPDEGFTRQVSVIEDVGNGKGVKFTTKPVSRGIKVAKFSQKEAGAGISYQSEVVSTADIRFVTFGPQVTRKKYLVSNIESGKSRGVNFTLQAPETTKAFSSLLKSNMNQDPSKSVQDRFGSEYDRILTSISSFSQSLGVSGDSKTIGARSKAESVSKALKNFGNLPLTAADQTTAQVYRATKKADPAAVDALVGILGKALWSYLNQAMGTAKTSKGFDESYDEYMSFRSDFIRSYTNGQVKTSDSDPGKAFFYSEEFKETADWTPIFPVSDAAGYEVFGNLPYGRGINIERYSELLQSQNTGQSGEDATAAAQKSVTLVGTSGGSNASSLQAIEKFFAAYLLSDNTTTALSALNGAEKKAILATLNTTADGLAGAVETLKKQDASQNAKIRNSPVTSFFRGQSVFGDTAARNLADLDAGSSSSCVCKGVEATFLLSAFSEEFVELYPEDPATGYAEQNAFVVTEAWKQTKDALSGRNMDTRNSNLAQEFTSGGNTANSYSNLAASLVQGIRSSTDEGT